MLFTLSNASWQRGLPWWPPLLSLRVLPRVSKSSFCLPSPFLVICFGFGHFGFGRGSGANEVVLLGNGQKLCVRTEANPCLITDTVNPMCRIYSM